MLSSVFLFLNIGGSEMALILFAALMLFGGDKLPEIARGLGKGIREFKDASEDVKREINNQINNHIDDIKSVAKIESPAAEAKTEQTTPLLEEGKTEPAAEVTAQPGHHVENSVPNTIPVADSYVSSANSATTEGNINLTKKAAEPVSTTNEEHNS